MPLTLIKALTASSSSSLDFVDGTSDVVFDNTYNEYQFQFVNIHAATDSTAFGFQVNATDDAGGDYDTSPITSTHFKAEHREGGAGAVVTYTGSGDQGQGTAYQRLTYDVEIDNDEAFSGVLTVYDPSSTTYVKHFQATGNYVHNSGKYSQNIFVAGYINDTTAIDEISFKMESGNIDAGTIYMYGVS